MTDSTGSNLGTNEQQNILSRLLKEILFNPDENNLYNFKEYLFLNDNITMLNLSELLEWPLSYLKDIPEETYFSLGRALEGTSIKIVDLSSKVDAKADMMTYKQIVHFSSGFMSVSTNVNTLDMSLNDLTYPVNDEEGRSLEHRIENLKQWIAQNAPEAPVTLILNNNKFAQKKLVDMTVIEKINYYINLEIAEKQKNNKPAVLRLVDFLKKNEIAQLLSPKVNSNNLKASFFELGAAFANTPVVEIDLSESTIKGELEIRNYQLFFEGLQSVVSNSNLKKIDLRLISFAVNGIQKNTLSVTVEMIEELSKSYNKLLPLLELVTEFKDIEEFKLWVKNKKSLNLSNGRLQTVLKLFPEKDGMYHLARALHGTAVEQINFEGIELNRKQILDILQGLEIKINNTNDVTIIKVSCSPLDASDLPDLSEFKSAYKKTKLRRVIYNKTEIHQLIISQTFGYINANRKIVEFQGDKIDELASLMSNLHLLPAETKKEIVPVQSTQNNPGKTIAYPDSNALTPTYLKMAEIKYACGIFLALPADDLKASVGKFLPMLNKDKIEKFRLYRALHSQKIGRPNDFQPEGTLNQLLNTATNYWNSTVESFIPNNKKRELEDSDCNNINKKHKKK